MPCERHVIKDSHIKDLNLITCLDDAPLSVTGYTLFEEATSENAVAVLLHHATAQLDVQATIL